MGIEDGLAGQPAAREQYGALWTALQIELGVLDDQAGDAQETARLRQYLRQSGTPSGPYDLQLAGMALAQGLTVVTNNTPEFAHAPGVTCEDWRAGRGVSTISAAEPGLDGGASRKG